MKEHISGEISGEYVPNLKWNTSKDSFNSLGSTKVNSLKETVEEIEELIEERKILSEKFVREGEAMKTKINNFLMESSPKGKDDSEFARERSELRKKQIDISQTQLDEQIECWKDIALLKRELRDRTKELNEKESRAEMLGRILGED